MKGRNNPRTHRGNYGTHKIEGHDHGKHKRPADYSSVYNRAPHLSRRPAMYAPDVANPFYNPSRPEPQHEI